MRSLNGLLYAKHHNTDNTFLFINYIDLVENTESTIKKIYKFCNWKHFEHNFDNIVSKYKENDSVYNLNGMHDVHPSIKKPDSAIVLPQEIIDKCLYIDNNINALFV